jgi:hypothetical protein
LRLLAQKCALFFIDARAITYFFRRSELEHVLNSRRALATTFVLALTATACERTIAGTEPLPNAHLGHAAVAASSPLGGADNALLHELQAAIARFHSTKQAEKAGYASDPHCVEVPGLGGMGHHWVNDDLVDPVFDARNPEALLYAPDKNGKMKLLGVEYIVINTGQPAPTFGGEPFNVGGTPIPAAHWSLHVWLGKPNPSGLFAPFNPDVDCP